MKRIISVLLCVLLLPAFCACSPSIPVPDDPMMFLCGPVYFLTDMDDEERLYIAAGCDWPHSVNIFNPKSSAPVNDEIAEAEEEKWRGAQKTVKIFGREHTGTVKARSEYQSISFWVDPLTNVLVPGYLAEGDFRFYYSEELERTVYFCAYDSYYALLQNEQPEREKLSLQQLSDICFTALSSEFDMDGWTELESKRKEYRYENLHWEFTFAKLQDEIIVAEIMLTTDDYGNILCGNILPGRPKELPDSVPLPDWPEETYKELILQKLQTNYEEQKNSNPYMPPDEVAIEDITIQPYGYTYYYLPEYESHAIYVTFDYTTVCYETSKSWTDSSAILILYDA